jgi:hypothetical protein
MTAKISTEIQTWPIDKLVLYARNPRKNDAAVDRMCASIREFGFKIPCLVRSDGEVIDGHLRLKAARRLEIAEIPVILCDEWTLTQVKAFRIMVNRSATWADWDQELLALELQDLQTSGYDLALTGFDTQEIDALVLNDAPDEDAVPPVPYDPVTCMGDLWLCGSHRVLSGDATDAEVVTRLLEERKPMLMVTDPPYGIELDSEWRDKARLNSPGSTRVPYAKHRTKGHQETKMSGDTRADWSDAFALVPSLEVGVCFSRIEVYPRSSRWFAADWISASPTDHLGQGANGAHADALLVWSRAGLVRPKEERSLVWKGGGELDNLEFTVSQIHPGRIG